MADEEVVSAKGILKVDIVRVIAEALASLGYSQRRMRLEEESGVALYSPVVERFMSQILEGRWNETVGMFAEMGLTDETKIKSASLLILEQKFSELLSEGNTKEAVHCLRNEITPHGDELAKKLAPLLFQVQVPEVESREKFLYKLQCLLPPFLIPKFQLFDLVEQGLELQASACMFHNCSIGELLLFPNHQCERARNIPSKTLQVLDGHEDDVCLVQFSHNGKYMASSSYDHVVIIWEVKAADQVTLKHKLHGHSKRVSCIAWSPDDDQLLTCGLEEVVRRWDTESGASQGIYEERDSGTISCAWAADGKHVFAGLTDRSVRKWNLEGNEVKRWEGMAYTMNADLEVMSEKFITVLDEKKIVLFGLTESHSKETIKESKPIISFSLSKDKKLLLVSLSNKKLELWNIDMDIPGLWGSTKVYIWHRFSGHLIRELRGHVKAVNCVSWNPTYRHMLASASDDGTIRIWGLKKR